MIKGVVVVGSKVSSIQSVVRFLSYDESCLVSAEPPTHFHVVVEYPAAAAVSIFVHLSSLGAALGWESATAAELHAFFMDEVTCSWQYYSKEANNVCAQHWQRQICGSTAT